ncbi:uncharacterized protein [Primulina huaijiensis]|uniref:uncharacterized protein isoform X2 n=1 Tax=Primulina huaijiensis TaxID=1492673 RepID=UPI003CC71F1C
MVEKEREIIEIDDSYPAPDEKDTPLKPIFCLKNRGQLKEIEKKEECFILEFDHNDELDILKLGISEDLDDAASPDVRVVAEKGQCYCYVCDSSAPCEMWTGSSGHCHAFNNEAWNNLRTSKRQAVTTT